MFLRSTFCHICWNKLHILIPINKSNALTVKSNKYLWPSQDCNKHDQSLSSDQMLPTYLPEFQHWSIFLSSLKGKFLVPAEGAGSGLRLCDCGLWRHWGFHMHWHSSSRPRTRPFLSLCGRFWDGRCCSRSRGMKPMTWPLSPRGTDKVANEKTGEENPRQKRKKRKCRNVSQEQVLIG